MSVLIQPGTYFLSDPCYAVPNDLWSDLLSSCDFFDHPVGNVTVDGKKFKVLAFSTAYGDGTYAGSNGFDYGVDAGLIGLTPKELITDADFNPALGTFVTFTKPTVCSNNEGYMVFGDITIDTACEEEDEDEDEYED